MSKSEMIATYTRCIWFNVISNTQNNKIHPGITSLNMSDLEIRWQLALLMVNMRNGFCHLDGTSAKTASPVSRLLNIMLSTKTAPEPA